MACAGDVAPQAGDLLGEQRAGFPDRVAVGLHHGDGFGRFGGEFLAARRERRGGPFLKVGDPGKRRVETLALGLVLGDGNRQRPLGPLDTGRSIADMLVEDQERAAVDRVLLGGVDSAAQQGPKRLAHGCLHAL